MAGIKYQIKSAFEEINEIGNSKIKAREDGDYSKIHSIKYFVDALDTGVKFGEYCKEHFGIKKIFDIRSDHYNSYIKYKENQGCTKGHLINIESHLKRLQLGMEELSRPDKMNLPFTPFVEKRLISSSQREQPKDRSYTKYEIENLKKNFSPNVRNAMELSLSLGLRIKEVCNIRVEHIVESNGNLKLFIPEKENGGGKGITKGGRFRDVPIPRKFEQKIRQLINGKKPKQKILDVKQGTLRSALKRSCDKLKIKSKGWHGFRHTYARNRLEDLLEDKKEVGKEIIRIMLMNREKHQNSLKGLEDHKDLQFVLDKINQVHSELGHGKNRWGLLAVYLSF